MMNMIPTAAATISNGMMNNRAMSFAEGGSGKGSVEVAEVVASGVDGAPPVTAAVCFTSDGISNSSLTLLDSSHHPNLVKHTSYSLSPVHRRRGQGRGASDAPR